MAGIEILVTSALLASKSSIAIAAYKSVVIGVSLLFSSVMGVSIIGSAVIVNIIDNLPVFQIQDVEGKKHSIYLSSSLKIFYESCDELNRELFQKKIFCFLIENRTNSPDNFVNLKYIIENMNFKRIGKVENGKCIKCEKPQLSLINKVCKFCDLNQQLTKKL